MRAEAQDFAARVALLERRLCSDQPGGRSDA
jgi:hypothetical protein